MTYNMNYMKIRLSFIGLMLVSISFVCFGQTRQEKTVVIINKLNLIKSQKTNYEFQLEPLKYQVVGKDSLEIIELEKKLSEEEIGKRISLAFDEIFNDEEINVIYGFIQTSAFEKFFNLDKTYKIISSKFKDIDNEIKEITNRLGEPIEKPTKKFEPIPVDKLNGFYATVDYNYSAEDKDIKLEANPSLTSKDILEVKKTYDNHNSKPEISIVLTKDGARKFYLLTKDNIGKPIAIVISNKIVSLPKVNSEIMGGKATISGDFTEDEIDKMIEILKEK